MNAMGVPLKALGLESKDDDQLKGMGWLPDLPDYRDYTFQTEAISSILKILKLPKKQVPSLPVTADLRQWFSPIEDQGNLGSCTANAGVGLFEYFEKRAFGKYIDASRLFLYKVTRNLM